MSAFCESCLVQTTDFSPGNIGTINGWGARWVGNADRCPRCGSTVRRLTFTALWIPFPGGQKYRVIELGNGEFLARPLAPPGGPDRPVSHCPICRKQFYNAMVELCPTCRVPPLYDPPKQ